MKIMQFCQTCMTLFILWNMKEVYVNVVDRIFNFWGKNISSFFLKLYNFFYKNKLNVDNAFLEITRYYSASM